MILLSVLIHFLEIEVEVQLMLVNRKFWYRYYLIMVIRFVLLNAFKSIILLVGKEALWMPIVRHLN
jgi:hypothetical protein